MTPSAESAVMITVWSGLSPPPLESLSVPELAHLEVFTSRSSDEGRERYRLHVGYFSDPTAAERLLPRLREIYPSAWVVPASRHRPLARGKAQAMRTWTADADSPAIHATPLPPLLLPPLGVAGPDSLTAPPNASPEAPAFQDETSLHSIEALRDEISLDMGEILALLEDSQPPAPFPREVAEAEPMAVAVAPTSAMQSADPVQAFARFSIEEWRAEEPAAVEPPAARSWLKRLPKLTRLVARRRAKN